jgi:hypothetical protein
MVRRKRRRKVDMPSFGVDPGIPKAISFGKKEMSADPGKLMFGGAALISGKSGRKRRPMAKKAKSKKRKNLGKEKCKCKKQKNGQK